jgi:hypothetical protein
MGSFLMLFALIVVFAASGAPTLPDAPATGPRAIDHVLSDTPRLDATDSKDGLTDKMLRACLDAHGGDTTLCRQRVTTEQRTEVPRHQVEEQKDRLDPVGERPH